VQGNRAIATMGCYGIGISRLLAAIVEQCHDEVGIVWPIHLAPFHIILISIGNSAVVQKQSQQIYDTLREEGLDVLWDDRKERPGVKFRDAELMGLPLRLVVGERGLAKGMIECRLRSGSTEDVQISDVPAKAGSLIHCR